MTYNTLKIESLFLTLTFYLLFLVKQVEAFVYITLSPPDIAVYETVNTSSSSLSNSIVPTERVLKQEYGYLSALGSPTVNFGDTPLGTPVFKQLIVQNTGLADLDITSTPTLPPGFSLVGGFPTGVLAQSLLTDLHT